jgi:hypothetical protein
MKIIYSLSKLNVELYVMVQTKIKGNTLMKPRIIYEQAVLIDACTLNFTKRKVSEKWKEGWQHIPTILTILVS